jgi:hypothetical protein
MGDYETKKSNQEREAPISSAGRLSNFERAAYSKPCIMEDLKQLASSDSELEEVCNDIRE